MEGERSPSGSGAGESSGPLRGSIVSSACQSCKKKKAKCDGGPPPCTPCRKRQTQCIFAPELDQRRRLAKRTRVEEAQFTQRLAEGLILKIRNSDDGELAELIDTIRRGASVKEIATYIHQNGNGPGTSSTPESSDASLPVQKAHQRDHAAGNVPDRTPWHHWSNEGLQKSWRHTATKLNGDTTPQGDSPSMSNYRRRLMSIEELVEANPLYDVPARPWTAQTVSDNLFSHLISLFLTWWAPYWNILLEGGLISALKSRDLHHPLCSPFLVNAILAVASQLSDSPVVCTRVDEPISRGENFHDEAQSLWAKERSNPSLTNMQALFVLWSDSKIRGREEVAWALLQQLLAMHDELGLSHQIPSLDVINHTATEKYDTEQIEQSFRLIAWANYNLAAGAALIAQKRIMLTVPTFGLPFSNQQVKANRRWCAYPRRDNVAIPQNAVTNANCDLAIRCAKINELLYRDDGTLDIGACQPALRPLLQNLEQWRNSQPEALQPGRANPPIITEIYGMFYTLLMAAQKLITPSDHDGRGDQQHYQASSTQQDRTIAHIQAMLPILTDYRDTYSYEATPYSMVQAVEFGSCTLVPSLNGMHSAPWQYAFTELCACLVAVGRRYGGCKDAVFRLQRAVERAGVQLPGDVQRQLAEFEHFFGAPNQRGRLDSMYPHFARAMKGIDGM